LKLVGIVARRVGNLPTNFLVFLRRFVLNLSANTCQMRHMTLTFDFEPPKSITSSSLYPKVIPYTRFEHFGIIRFRVMLRTNRQTDRQTNKQIRLKILPTPTDRVGVGNNVYILV